MGQIAEDLNDGTVCCLCGQFFEDSPTTCPTHGYPVVCWDCFDKLGRNERRHYQRALYPVLGTAEEKAEAQP